MYYYKDHLSHIVLKSSNLYLYVECHHVDQTYTQSYTISSDQEYILQPFYFYFIYKRVIYIRWRGLIAIYISHYAVVMHHQRIVTMY